MKFGILGPLQVLSRDDEPVDVRGSKLRTVLTLLILRAGETVTTDQLAEAIWGDSPPLGADNALQTHISKLRRLLEPGMLETRDGAYSLVLGASTVDADEFSRLATAGHEYLAAGNTSAAAASLREALALWRGPVLAEVADLDFAVPYQVRLGESWLSAREDLLDAELAAGGHDAVVAATESALVENPLRERLWGLLMTALYRSGRQADALRAFQRARDVLGEELGLEPGPALQGLERRILDQDAGLLPAESTTPTAQQLSNLLPSLSSFVGRGTELNAIRALIGDRRLVTLTGPGGVGKTRLATEVATASKSDWPDGCWFVDLGTEVGEDALDRAFVRTFGPRLGHPDTDTLGWLILGLSNAKLLIVLDNCEHVIASVSPFIESLLRSCPHVHVLATSREPLGCTGEVNRRLEPLSLEDAISLFTSRSSDSSVELGSDEITTAAVQEICAQLDRLPLAIELTAARTRVYSAPQLAALLQQRSRLTSTDSASRPPRQQTLDAAVDWSYELLFEAERHLLSRLSVFSGGFTLDSVIAVCADDDLPAEDVGLMLARLVDKSLVSPITHHGSVQRFRLLRPVAEFAAQRLEEAGETRTMRSSHARWVVGFTAPVMTGLRGPDAIAWAHVVNEELDNLHRAAQWSLAGGDATDGLQIAVNLGWYAFLSANVHDDHAALLAILDRTSDAESPLRCRGMMWAGLLSIGQSDGRTWAMDAIDVVRTATRAAAPTAPRVLQQNGFELTHASIELARKLRDPQLLMEALGVGALNFAAVGAFPDAVAAMSTEVAQLATELGDAWYSALTIGLDGLCAYVQHDHVRAIGLYAQCIFEMRRLGDANTAAMFEISSCETAEFLGDLTGAIESMSAAYAASIASHFRSSSILCSILCWLTARNGEVQRSLALGREGLAAVRRPFNPVIRAQALFALGTVEELAKLDELAEEHLTEALSIHTRVGMTREAALDHRSLGLLFQARGDISTATEHHRRALRLALDVGLPWTVAMTTRALAAVTADGNKFELACCLVGISDGLDRQFGYVATALERQGIGALLQRCVDQVGSHVVDAAIARGTALGVEGITELLAL